MKFNEIFAHFMGGVITGKEPYEMPHGSNHTGEITHWSLPKGVPSDSEGIAKIGLFRYHNDWNWLQPVIDKIETLYTNDAYYRVVMYKNTCTVEIRPNTDKWYTLFVVEDKDKITATYNALGKLLTDLKIKK